jgi:hypothetical protein
MRAERVPFCGSVSYAVLGGLDERAADAAAAREWERYHALNREPSCQALYREFLCSASFPGCVPNADGSVGSVLACREPCLYSRLCGFPPFTPAGGGAAGGRAVDCQRLNSVHEKGFMIRLRLQDLGFGSGVPQARCLSMTGGSGWSAHPADGRRYGLSASHWVDDADGTYGDEDGIVGAGAKTPTAAQYLYLLAAPGRHAFGMTGVDNFGHGDRIFLDAVLARHPELRHAVEFGTYKGETSLFLGMVMRTRGGALTTFDIEDHRRPEVRRGWLDNMHFVRADILTRPSAAVIAALADPATLPKLVLVDNGDKLREAQMYARHIPVGSGFAVHDWDQEISAASLAPTVAAHGFEERLTPLALALNSNLRFFLRVSALAVGMPDAVGGAGAVHNCTFSPFENASLPVGAFCTRHGLGASCAVVRAKVAELQQQAAAATTVLVQETAVVAASKDGT